MTRKAQFSMEYYVSLLLFVLFVTYLLFQVEVLTPAHLREIKLQALRLEAFQVSELLVNDPGEPSTWQIQGSIIRRVGLSAGTQQNFLSKAKVDELDKKCKEANGYINLYNWLGMRNQFNITIRDTKSPTALVDTEKDCPASSGIGRNVSVVVTRVVTFDNGERGNLTLRVW